MIHINDSTVIDKPVRQVFDFMSTPENDFQWQYGTLASSRLSEGISSSGTFFRSVGHVLGRRVQGTFEVTDYKPDRKYGFKPLSGHLHSQTSYTFKTTSGNTLVSITTQASLGPALHVEERKLERRLKKQLKENLKMLKDLLEESNPGMDASAQSG